MRFPRVQRRSAHRDITDAWQTARNEVAAAGLDLQRAPLFLTLGQPAGGLRNFFADTAAWPLPPSATASAPLEICGSREGLFVCLKQSSLLGAVAQQPGPAQYPAAAAPADPAPTAMQNSSPSGLPACRPAAQPDARDPVTETLAWPLVDGTTAAAQEAPRSDRHSGGPSLGNPSLSNPSLGDSRTGGPQESGTATMLALRLNTSRLAATADTTTSSAIDQRLCELEHQLAAAEQELSCPLPAAKPIRAAVAAPAPAPVLAPPAADRIIERLELLCRLISEAREPFCPVNGIVLLVPIQATIDAEQAERVGSCIRQDLETLLRCLETAVSVQVIVCGLDSCIGADELLDRLPEDVLQTTLGLSLPAAPKGEEGATERLIERASEWLCDELLPSTARRVFRRQWTEDGLAAPSDAVHQEGNRLLHELVQAIRGRREPLSCLLRESLASTAGQLRLRGCFFAATGSAELGQQAFTAGILPRIYGIQHEVRWLESRRRRDTRQLAATVAGYAVLLAASVLTAALIAA